MIDNTFFTDTDHFEDPKSFDGDIGDTVEETYNVLEAYGMGQITPTVLGDRLTSLGCRLHILGQLDSAGFSVEEIKRVIEPLERWS